jgi:hypothetical protein
VPRRWAVFIFLVVFLPSGRVCAEEMASKIEEDVRFGIGIGIPYGLFGVNFETSLTDYVSATAGFGSLQREFDFAVGGRVYPFKRSGRFGPRVSALLGTVKMLSVGDSSGPLFGGALGFGFDWKFYGRNSLDLDLFYAIYQLPKGYTDNGPLELSLGYGYHF